MGDIITVKITYGISFFFYFFGYTIHVVCCRKVEKNKGIKSNKGINFYNLHICGRKQKKTPGTKKKRYHYGNIR